MSGDLFAEGLAATARLLWYFGCLGVVGASAFRLFVSPAADAQATAAAVTGRVVVVGQTAAVVLVAGVFARVYAQTYAFFGLEETVTLALVYEVATDLPPWSGRWMAQGAAAVCSLAAWSLAGTGRRMAEWAAHSAAAAVVITAPLTGHAMALTDDPRWSMALQVLHVLGAGVWIGGLAVLRVVAADRASSPAVLTALVRTFSPLALAGAGLLALSGAATTMLYVDSLGDLVSTPWGQVLSLKVVLVLGVALTGFINWQRVRPRLTDAGGTARLRRIASLELALATLVLAATAVLVGYAPPGG